VRKGTYKWMPKLPAIPGIEMSGTVVKAGPGVRSLKVGQPVFVSAREFEERAGCYAEYVKAPEHKIYPVPADWAKRAYVDEAKYKEMYARSIKDPNGFWAEQAKRIHWYRTPSRIKNTSFGHVSTEVRLEVFNVLNHPQFANPNGQLGNAAFGTISAMLASPSCALCGTTERQMQLAFKVKF